jgi:peptidoglycan/xylan/chitin deacetylase (PgdA/CDA1 family)
MQRRIIFAAMLAVSVFLLYRMELTAQERGIPTSGEKTIAVTIDDLPLNGPNVGKRRLTVMTNKLLSAIAKNKIPVVGFVNESLIYEPAEADARIELLTKWSAAGVELGNHTFSHLGFKGATLAAFEDDFVRGDPVTSKLISPRKMRYFRHPFLQMGATAELEHAFESFIAERGYQIAPVTIDILDWMFLSAYEQARAMGDPKKVIQVSEEYLKYAPVKFDFCERESSELFGRQIPQILLLHANELNADNIDKLATMLKARGYRFISLEDALKDPVYRFPDKYLGTSDWLGHWAFSKGKSFEAPKPPDFVQKAFSSGQQVKPKSSY